MGSFCGRVSGDDGTRCISDEDLVLLAASFYLLRQDAVRVAQATEDRAVVIGTKQPIAATMRATR